MNENIRKLVEQLKSTIAQDPVIVEYLEAKRAYINDKTLVNKANEYNVQRQILESESQKETKDEQLVESVKARLDKLYKEISESDTAHRLVDAEDGVNEFYNEIVAVLQSVVAPEHGDCSGQCSSCGGCH